MTSVCDRWTDTESKFVTYGGNTCQTNCIVLSPIALCVHTKLYGVPDKMRVNVNKVE
jgi:hypothetical protein